MKKILQFLFLISCLTPAFVQGAAGEEPIQENMELFDAVKKGTVEEVEECIEKVRAEGKLEELLLHEDVWGNLPIHYAASRNIEITQLLLDAADDNRKLLSDMLGHENRHGSIPADRARWSSSFDEIVNMFFSKVTSKPLRKQMSKIVYFNSDLVAEGCELERDRFEELDCVPGEGPGEAPTGATRAQLLPSGS